MSATIFTISLLLMFTVIGHSVDVAGSKNIAFVNTICNILAKLVPVVKNSKSER
jgi:hypothetical protein